MLTTLMLGVFGVAQALASGIAPSVDGAAAISGSLIAGTKKCAAGKAQAWISTGSLLLYQAEVAFEGSFEFHLRPGRYNIAITSSTGCFAEKSFELKANEVQEINLALLPQTRGVAGERGQK